MTGEIKKIANDGTIKLELEASYYNTTSFNPIKTIKITISEDSTKIKFIDVDHDTAECNDPSISSYTTTLESVLEGAVKNPDNGNVYNIFKDIASWDDAVTFCKALGGQLAYISNDLENSALCALVTERGSYSPVFGITDKDKEGKWVDPSGVPASYTNWADGEPSNYKEKEHYAHFKAADGTWNDNAWTGEIICEWSNVSKILTSSRENTK